MRTRGPHALTFIIGAALTVAGAGCGGSSSSSAPPTTPDGKRATLGVADHDLGTMLVDAQGRTLYVFAKDTGPKSTCTGACLTQWPRVTVKGKPAVGWERRVSHQGERQADGAAAHLQRSPLYLYAGGASRATKATRTSMRTGIWRAVAPSVT
jgi:predicted lipoprotein with Yx(FWY)xxD motif